jgi:hypothetical protein
MRSAFLVAGNFVRENRWPVLLLMLWGIASGIAAAYSVRGSEEDALYFLKQQAAYNVFFSVFLAASALNTQRRTRRILAVLAKGIERREYLAGILFGYSFVGLIYSLALGLTGYLTFARAGSNPLKVAPLILMLLCATVLAGTVALFFSTFSSPLVTLIATSLVLGGGAALNVHVGGKLMALFPVYTLLRAVLEFSFQHSAEVHWIAVLSAVIETVLLWLAASWLFSRRDVTVPVE